MGEPALFVITAASESTVTVLINQMITLVADLLNMSSVKPWHAIR